jgi:hypothetical protein
MVATMGTPVAASGGPSARLVYARAPEASSCPDESALRNAVAARLGYDPFFPWAKQTVVVQVWREARRYRARLQLVDAAGLAHGTRTLASEQSTCAELFDAAALAISIAMDSFPTTEPEPSATPSAEAATRPTTPPTASSEPTTVPSTPPATPPGPASAERASTRPSDAPDSLPVAPSDAHLQGFAGLDILGVSGAEPAPTGALAAFGGIVSRIASLSLEVRADAPVSANSAAGTGRVRAWSYAIAVAPCARYRVASLCAVGAVGLLYGRADDITDPRSDSTLFATAGARLGADWPLSGAISLRTHLDASAELRRIHLQIGGSDGWISPLAAFSAGAGIAARFE